MGGELAGLIFSSKCAIMVGETVRRLVFFTIGGILNEWFLFEGRHFR